MCRSPGGHGREGPAFPCSSVCWQDKRQTAPFCFQEPGSSKDSCRVSAKWCADSQPPIACTLGRLPSPCALAKPGGRSRGWLTSALLKLQQRRRLEGNTLFSFPPIHGCKRDVSKLSGSSREAAGNWPCPVSWQIAPCLNLDPSYWRFTQNPPWVFAIGSAVVKCRREKALWLVGTFSLCC